MTDKPCERPILMCEEMVRAILDGRKTQTRRLIKPQPIGGPARAKLWSGRKWVWESNSGKIGIFHPPHFKCKYGAVGDRLWVKETFAQHPDHPTVAPIYRADRGGDYQGAAQGDFKWKPSIFMPRWASRITREIVSVRVERVQEITEDDAKAEGCNKGYTHNGGAIECDSNWRYRDGFADLWDSINGDGSWACNLWVFAIEFRNL